MPKQTTGEFMALLRKANGYTQAEVAERLNISNKTLSSWETDRTLPDVLMLPAIADLYKVTVDELLRGEKATEKTVSEPSITEKSLKNVRKQRYGKFNVRINLLTGIALLSEAVVILACLLSLFTSSPLWLNILLGVLGGVGACVCAVLSCYYGNSLKLSEGIVNKDDYTEENKPFLLCIKRKIADFFGICSLPFALSTVALIIAFIIINPQNQTILNVVIKIRKGYITVIAINAVLFAVTFVASVCIRLVELKRLATGTQYATHKSNMRFLRKTALFGLIPVAAMLVLNITLACVFPNAEKTLYQCDDFLAFKTHLYTLVIKNNEAIPDGEYYLAFPKEEAELGTEYQFGNGFYGHYLGEIVEVINGHHKSVAYWEVGYDNETRHILIELCAYRLNDNASAPIVNARYREYDRHVREYDFLGNPTGEIFVVREKGYYRLKQDISLTLESVALYTLIVVPLIDIAVCAVIFAAKRKKY